MKISAGFIQKYNVPGPRYTSYPPATSFHGGFSADDFLRAVEVSNNNKPTNISFYFHIPFCRQRCFFCGCNTSAFEAEDIINLYIDTLLTEMDRVFRFIEKKRLVSQVHFGGGTPNAIPLHFLEKIMNYIRKHFNFSQGNEIAIECNPAYLDPEDIDTLKRIGFNRISLGVQDFHESVLKVINRLPSKHPLELLVEKIRQQGFKGFNIDLVYGLPTQNPEIFKENIEKVLHLMPDRVVTFSYAHVPWVNELQKKLEGFSFPSPDDKIDMLIHAMQTLTANGYMSIGMDHFAREHDELALAMKNRRVHRNFQGYCTKDTTGQVYAFGASSISQLRGYYFQNAKNTREYIDMIKEHGVAVMKGYKLSDTEIMIRDVINEIMCNGFVDFEHIAVSYNLDVNAFLSMISFNSSKLELFERDKLLTFSNNKISVSPEGMLAVRNIAMALDPALESTHQRFSNTV